MKVKKEALKTMAFVSIVLLGLVLFFVFGSSSPFGPLVVLVMGSFFILQSIHELYTSKSSSVFRYDDSVFDKKSNPFMYWLNIVLKISLSLLLVWHSLLVLMGVQKWFF